MLLSIEGQEKTGKTGFAYTAPLPIVGFQFDLGHDRAIRGPLYTKYFKDLDIHEVKIDRIKGPENSEIQWSGHDITIYELPQPIQLDSRDLVGYIKLWDYFISLIGSAFGDPNVSSVVLDTATVARGSVKTNAYIEELNERNPQNKRKQLLQIEYGHVNSAFENIYTIAKSIDKNFIALHHLRDEYKDQNIRGEIQSVTTGRYELDGWNKTYRFVDTAIRNTFNNGTFESEIIVCGDNPSLVGTKMQDMDWNMLVDLISMSLGGRVNYDRR
jgi:hypothetical protein